MDLDFQWILSQKAHLFFGQKKRFEKQPKKYKFGVLVSNGSQWWFICAQKCQGREIKPKNANEAIPFAILIIMMKFTRFLRFSLCDSIIEFRSKSEIEIQILVTMNIFAEAVIPISF